ncbi:hypothetical protein GCM10020331_057110 [Ectobacillus funiculus]
MSKPRLVVVGSLNMDIVVETKRYPLVGETLMGDKVSFIPGGKGGPIRQLPEHVWERRQQ